MPRIARVVVPGHPHHITQRGNYRQDIFVDDTDRDKYLSLLHKESNKYGLKLLAYSLMSNHVHFIGMPKNEESLGNVFKYVNMKYSQYFNRKIGKGGHLFQGRFFSSVMDERYTLACARYIERNPVRAKMVKRPQGWQWSSARVHCSIEKKDILKVNELFDYVGKKGRDWQDFIEEHDYLQEIKEIRQQTIRGRPLGNGTFLKKLEKKLNRSLIIRSAGRPKNKK